MPTDLGRPYKPTWKGNYPHMLPEDRPIWDRFLTLNPSLFLEVYYDVLLGGVYPGPEYGSEKMRKMFHHNTAKRIDVLGILKDEVWIVEVASHPGLRAVGQLQTYMALWFQDPKIQLPVKGVLVCRSIDADLEAALKFYGMLLRYTF